LGDILKWFNYFLTGKNSRLTEGHLNSEDLYQKILSHDGSTAFCCYFDLDYSALKVEYWHGKYDTTEKPPKKIYSYLPQGQEHPDKDHFKPEITFTQYEGIARPALNMVSFDFDAEDATDAIEDVRKFCEWLAVDDLAVFYSGSKGFHVMVPFGYFPLEANPHLPNQLKDLATELKKTFKTLDTSIYQHNRKFRVPFTKHDKSERFKSFIPLEYLHTLSLEAIQDNAAHHSNFDFLEDIKPYDTRNALDILITLNETVKRVSYEIEKDKAGTKNAPSKFEAYDGKLCIKKLLESRCDDVGRNNAAMRIVNDFFRTGKTKAACEEIVYKWAEGVSLPRSEVSAIIGNIYERGANYNFGCQDEIKSTYCSAKCAIWKKLDPDKRPITVDMPTSEASNVKEFNTVNDLLTQTFKCRFDSFKREFHGGLIVKQGKEDLFYYDDGMWNYLDHAGSDKIKRRINAMVDGKLTIKKIEAFYKMFMVYVPAVPEGVDMFRPNPLCANFNNGTLHLQEDGAGKFFLEFKEHSPKDWITFKIKHDYVPDATNTNKRFDEMLDTIFKDDEHKADKVNAIAEMFGASLIPYFPHLFYLYGEANSGKSTIMIILKQLLGDGENISSVEPKDFQGFNLESMAGKLVNMVLDVDTRRAIQDNVVKQIEDRSPITIRRKNRTDITAPLPSVHIFGGNDLLTSYEGYSNAMKRRWTILKFDRAYTGPKMRNFAGQVFTSDPQGLINFAIMGLKKLVESQGYFTQFESSTKELEEWSEESDVVAQFLEEAIRGETGNQLVKHENAKIERKILYDMFNEWQESSGYRNQAMHKIQFYKRVKSKGFEVKTIAGVRYFAKLGELTAKHLASNEPKLSNDNI
jgi:putative DNA primase/helicase